MEASCNSVKNKYMNTHNCEPIILHLRNTVEFFLVQTDISLMLDKVAKNGPFLDSVGEVFSIFSAFFYGL